MDILKTPIALPDDSDVAFFCTCDDGFLVPSVIALQSIRRFHPSAGYFIMGTFEKMDKALAMFEAFQINYLPLAESDLFQNVISLATGKMRWPRECFWHLIAYPLLMEKGYNYTCCIDGDVLCVNPVDFSQTFAPDIAVAAVVKKNGLLNSGVLFYNNTLLARLGFAEMVISHYQTKKICEHPECVSYCQSLGDQELLQHVLEDFSIPWKQLSTYYNHLLPYPYSLYAQRNCEVLTSVEECIFLHMMLKPWLNETMIPTLYPLLQKSFYLWKEVAVDVLPLLKEFM
jgi:lipopolysaccharide biosynthesis glycosyltransferase